MNEAFGRGEYALRALLVLSQNYSGEVVRIQRFPSSKYSQEISRTDSQ